MKGESFLLVTLQGHSLCVTSFWFPHKRRWNCGSDTYVRVLIQRVPRTATLYHTRWAWPHTLAIVRSDLWSPLGKPLEIRVIYGTRVAKACSYRGHPGGHILWQRHTKCSTNTNDSPITFNARCPVCMRDRGALSPTEGLLRSLDKDSLLDRPPLHSSRRVPDFWASVQF